MKIGFNQINKHFGAVHANADITLEIQAGKFTVFWVKTGLEKAP
jgi:ABC-type arginine transport system ATPase subunit